MSTNHVFLEGVCREFESFVMDIWTLAFVCTFPKPLKTGLGLLVDPEQPPPGGQLQR